MREFFLRLCLIAGSLLLLVQCGDDDGPTGPDGPELTLGEWTTVTPLVTGDLHDVVWGGGQFVAVGSAPGETYILTSPDGTTWTRQIPPVAASIMGIAWSGERYVAVGSCQLVIYSDDAVNWTSLGAAPV